MAITTPVFGDARLPSRFWSKVMVGWFGCWVWRGALSHGYGAIGWGHSRVRRAHRVAWETLVSPVSTGLDLDHLCRNRACAFPLHLEPVTRQLNVKRGRGNGSQTHCPSGHEYNYVNTTYRSNGARECRVCKKARRASGGRG